MCEEICGAMCRYGWLREYCMPSCMAADAERVRRMEEEEERRPSRAARADGGGDGDGDGGGVSSWPFV